MRSKHTNKAKAKGHRSQFRPSYAIVQQELTNQLNGQRVTALEVTQDPDGSYWIGVKLQGLTEAFFVATKRDITKPRRFVRLDVLVAFLKRAKYGGAIPLQLQLVAAKTTRTPRKKGR